ncbi:MAG: cytochrome c [Cyclobacteriaceae bacterium]
MKKINNTLLLILFVTCLVVVFTQCASQKAVSNGDELTKGAPEYVLQKSGAQLWAESCIRCHNTASPSTFSDVQWDVAVTHMKLRAQLTQVEAEKIAEFMKLAN